MTNTGTQRGLIVAFIGGAAALLFGLVRRARRARNRSIDVGVVSEGWLAEQRGSRTDGS